MKGNNDVIIQNTVLFHGTGEKIEGDLRGGGYDNILWTSDLSTVAQNYIPIYGMTYSINKPAKYELDECVKPVGGYISVAKELGYTCEIYETNYIGPSCWSWFKVDTGESCTFTKREFIDYIENTLGYESENGIYKISISVENGVEKLLPKDLKLKGRLYMFEIEEPLKFYNYSLGESDLTNLQCHDLSFFKKVKDLGYDGIIIDDFAQSKNWGNVEHISYGLFPRGIEKIKKIKYIEATNFDWEDSLDGFSVKQTPEYGKYKETEC